MKRVITDTTFEGERPLFDSHGLRLERVHILPGESALKECSDIEADHCTFEGKYPFWHIDGLKITDCELRAGARAALWYDRNIVLTDTLIEAPKTLREIENARIERVHIPHAVETFWHCRGIELRESRVEEADYIFFHSSDIFIDNYRQQGLYSFQYAKNVEIHNAIIHSKDAFWQAEDVTVYDSVLTGEYLGWHSRRLHLVNCSISGTQPLCYAHDLVLENCRFEPDCDLAFENSTVQATVNSVITSVKNPRSGRIVARGYGEIILDQHILAPADCQILSVDE